MTSKRQGRIIGNMSTDKTTKISVTIPGSLIEQVRGLSAKENRSFSNMLSVLIADGLNQRKNKAA